MFLPYNSHPSGGRYRLLNLTCLFTPSKSLDHCLAPSTVRGNRKDPVQYILLETKWSLNILLLKHFLNEFSQGETYRVYF